MAAPSFLSCEHVCFTLHEEKTYSRRSRATMLVCYE